MVDETVLPLPEEVTCLMEEVNDLRRRNVALETAGPPTAPVRPEEATAPKPSAPPQRCHRWTKIYCSPTSLNRLSKPPESRYSLPWNWGATGSPNRHPSRATSVAEIVTGQEGQGRTTPSQVRLQNPTSLRGSLRLLGGISALGFGNQLRFGLRSRSIQGTTTDLWPQGGGGYGVETDKSPLQRRV